MNILLFAGAGTSIELGVPGMVGMGEEFLEHTAQWDVEPDLVKKIMGSSMDVEHLIEELDRICTARTSLEAIGQDTQELARIDKIRAEVEWFVQHVAERVVSRDAHLMWGSVLRAARSINFTIVTTNYDRAIELAANTEGVDLDDGFAKFDDSETAIWASFGGRVEGTRLVKLHGSTDWYSDSETLNPTKLRHPMPLFGRAALLLANGRQLGSSLVLPSREKLLTRDPYPRLSQAFLNAVDSCDLAIFVGSSLRDHHIRSAARAVTSRVPVFIVNPKGDGCGVDRATAIPQYASTFLTATLANALADADPIAALMSAAANATNASGGSLSALRTALDRDAQMQARCDAIEELDEEGTALDPLFVAELLDDPVATVAQYALCLVPPSAARDVLLHRAKACIHVDHPAYAQDLALLEHMLS